MGSDLFNHWRYASIDCTTLSYTYKTLCTPTATKSFKCFITKCCHLQSAGEHSYEPGTVNNFARGVGAVPKPQHIITIVMGLSL